MRNAVFIVEQNCPYQDIDSRDKIAVHVFAKDENGVIAGCLRVLPPLVMSEHAAIGRVIAKERRSGTGTALLKAGISAAKEYFNADTLYVEAQTYARAFYERQGFVSFGDEFAEDGIMHIRMLRTPEAE